MATIFARSANGMYYKINTKTISTGSAFNECATTGSVDRL
jgi:hypothetical protein